MPETTQPYDLLIKKYMHEDMKANNMVLFQNKKKKSTLLEFSRPQEI